VYVAVHRVQATTLTAGDVFDVNPNGTVTRVVSYADANGDDRLDPAADALVGYGAQITDGT
jgi:hypothetical protein